MVDETPDTTAILLVDDEEMVRRTCSRVLRRGRFEVLTAKNGLEALEICATKQDCISAVLLDTTMPEMDGAEVIKQIRGFEQEKRVSRRHRVKIVMVTALANESMVLDCIQKGCDEYIVKPLSLKYLYRKLEKLGLLD